MTALLSLYGGLGHVAAPLVRGWLHRRARRGREDPARLTERFGYAALPRPDGPLVWIHAASVGEAMTAPPLITALQARVPGLSVLLTTGTVTAAGMVSARAMAGVIHQYVPVDLPAATARFLDHWRPDLALWIESELWPGLLRATARRGVAMGLINARMSVRSARRWGRAGGSARALLRHFDVIIAQDAGSAARLTALGAEGVTTGGNLKAAAAPLDADPALLEAVRAALGTRPVWLAASTHPGEEALAVQAHNALGARYPGLTTLIAPRHPDRGAALAAETGAPRRSTGAMPDAPGLYLVDTLGEMGVWFRAVPFALMGGSFTPMGGHNLLEPARLGCAVLTGPDIRNCADDFAMLAAAGAARRVEAPAVTGAVDALLAAPQETRAMGAAGRAATASGGAALEHTLTALAPLLPRLPA